MNLETDLRSLRVSASPPVLSGGDVRYRRVELAIGPMLLATRSGGALLASVFVAVDGREEAMLDRLGRAVSPRVLRGGAGPDDAARELEDYLAGRRRDFDLAVDPVLATPFQKTVLAALPSIGYGRTATYGGLAGRLGRPAASRAVGAALGANPLCVVLPCHRVVAADGALTGYAGGLDAKRALLTLEASA